MDKLEPCPFCGGTQYRIEAGGQTWRGVKGYSEPQYFHLYHNGKVPEGDGFQTCSVQIRARTEDELFSVWNTRAAPTVKPLVWEEPSKANNQCKIARAINGDYYVDACGGRHQAWLESITKPYEVQIGEMVGTMTEAKAAADAHHAAMILSSLEGVTG